MRKSLLLYLVPVAVIVIMISGVRSEVQESVLADGTIVKLSSEELPPLQRALSSNDQTPAEDRHLALRKLVKLGALAAILATPALAAALIPFKLIPLLLLLKHKIPPVNIIPLPPPPPPVYYDQPQYDSPPAYSPPAYSPPAYSPPAYSPPAYSPPTYNPPPPPQAPAYNPPQMPAYNPPPPPPYNPPSYQSSGYRK